MQEHNLQMFQTFISTHKDMLGRINMVHDTIVINAFAGPGAGKTTSAWEIASTLKKMGYSVELAPEYAKELVWSDRTDLLDGSEENQLEILQEQTRRLDILYGKVDFIITDCPLMLNSTYLAQYDVDYETLNMELFAQYHNFSYFVERDSDPSAYETDGSIHTYEQSVTIDNQLKDTLKRLNVYVGQYNHSTINKIVSNIIKHATGKVVNPSTSPKAELLPHTDHKDKKPSKREILNSISSEEAAVAFSSTEELEKLLSIMGRFNYYSSNNLLLLTAQFPKATVIKTYDEWQAAGYNISKGQHHFGIIKREEQNGKGKYIVQQMFDVSQTDADSSAFIAFKPTEKLIIKSLISIMGKGAVLVDGSKCEGECAFFNPSENVIYVETNLPTSVLINALVREMILYDIAGHTKYDRQKNIGIATASSYALCSRYNVDTSFLDLDYCLELGEPPNEKDIKSKIESIKGHTKDLSIQIDRYIEKVQKREVVRE